MSDSQNNKELVAVGHQFAKAMSSDTPIMDIAKIVSRLAERLDCTTAALREMTKQRDALATENCHARERHIFIRALALSILEHSGGRMDWRGAMEDATELLHTVDSVYAKTPATDAFLAEVRASTLEDLAKKKREEKMSLHPDTFALGSVIAALDMQANELEDLAAQLRQGGAA